MEKHRCLGGRLRGRDRHGTVFVRGGRLGGKQGESELLVLRGSGEVWIHSHPSLLEPRLHGDRGVCGGPRPPTLHRGAEGVRGSSPTMH